jgi:hypothetical protein
LPSELALLARISDWLEPSIDFALTARGELYSSLVACLKKTECGNPERAEREEAPASGRAEPDEQGREDQGRP